MREGSVGRIVASSRCESCLFGKCVGVMKEEGKMRSMCQVKSTVWFTHSDLDLVISAFSCRKGGPIK
jgi:hypothetical protein